MTYPVKLALYKNGHLFREIIAKNDRDLRCPIEMNTGVGWLDAAWLYQKMLDEGRDQVSDTFQVCHSYEKWGGMQQETVKIKVQLERLVI